MAWFSLTNFLSGTPTKVEFKFYDDSPFTLQLQNYTDAVNTNKAILFTTIQNSFVKEERPLTRPELEEIIAMKKELDALELENELRMANSEVEKNTKSCLVNQKSNSTINCRPEHRIWNSYKTTTCRSQKWAGQKTSNCVANRQKRLINTYKNTPQKELAKIYNEKVVVFLDKIKNIVPGNAAVPAPFSVRPPVPPPNRLAGGGKTRKNRSKKGKNSKTRRY